MLSYRVALTCSTQLITFIFKNAVKTRGNIDGLVFHSDQGGQYTSFAFSKLLAKHNITQSFSKKETPHDNAVAEAFFASFKKEELYRTNYRSESDLKRCISKYMEFYNNKRPHRTLNYATPSQFEKKLSDTL